MSNGNASNERMDRIESAMERFQRGLEHLLRSPADDRERLDRHEAALDKLLASQQNLLTAQVLLTETVGQLVEAQKRTDVKLAELAEAQKHSDEHVDRVVNVVEGLIRPRE